MELSRLCRLMCGDGFASPNRLPLEFFEAAPQTAAQPPKTGVKLPERQSLSAHQAAQPHNWQLGL